MLQLGMMKCLFAIAGDPAKTQDGLMRVRRLQSNEIRADQSNPHLLFSEISLRHSSESDDSYPMVRAGNRSGTYVQQFKFLRLAGGMNYEPIAMALKGLQIRKRPGSFLTNEQYNRSAKHRAVYHDLLDWGNSPEAISEKEIDAFLSAVEEGLATERFGKSAHSGAYVSWAIDQLNSTLTGFNTQLNSPAPE